MKYNFTTLKWFHPSKSIWITDYLYEEGDHFCIIEKIPVDNGLTRYNFIASKLIAGDIYIFLGEAINSIREKEDASLPEVRVINVGLSCEEHFRGSFNILLKATPLICHQKI